MYNKRHVWCDDDDDDDDDENDLSFDSRLACSRSDGGDAIVFDVVHYVVDLMSVNHVAAGYDRFRLGGLGGRDPAAGRGRRRRRAEPPEPQDREPRRHGHDDDGHG